MHYFVTGTAGFIGFHLARRLLADGHSVTGYDGMTPYYNLRLKEARNAALAQYRAFDGHEGMLEDRERLTRVATRARPDMIIHLAAQAGVRYSLENPKAYHDSNLTGSFHILEVARELGVKHLMLASTSSVYGANPVVPFSEIDKADEPMTLYAASKKAMEVMGHSYAHLYKVPTTAFRFFTVYGPWGRPDMALFKFVKAILKDKEIDVFGQGRMSRDFTYIDDLVEAIVRLSQVPPSEQNRVEGEGITDTLSRQAPFRVVNIGGGQPVGLMDFIKTVEAVLGRTARLNMMPMQQGDVPRTFASSELMERLIGYKPETGLDKGVRAFVDWYLDEGMALDEAPAESRALA